MRCPKCGYISFDYLSSCEKCGKDLEEVAAVLGPFLMDNSRLNWFRSMTMDHDTSEAPVQAAEPEIDPYVDLADIDVSDLVAEEAGSEQEEDVEEIIMLDSDLVETVTVDEDFQKALDDAVGE